jgi:hypothetical protein
MGEFRPFIANSEKLHAFASAFTSGGRPPILPIAQDDSLHTGQSTKNHWTSFIPLKCMSSEIGRLERFPIKSLMGKFTKESLRDLIDDEDQDEGAFGDRSQLKRDAFRKNYMPQQISDLTCEPQVSWSFCDDVLDCILKLKTPNAQPKATLTLLDLLRSPECDHFSLRASGLIGKVITAVVAVPARIPPETESLLAEILVVIASEEVNAPYFDEKSVDHVLRLLESTRPEVVSAGIRVLAALGRRIPTDATRTKTIVANVELRYSGSAAHAVRTIAQALPSSLAFFTPGAIAALAMDGQFGMVVDAVYRRRELAADPAIGRALLEAFAAES